MRIAYALLAKASGVKSTQNAAVIWAYSVGLRESKGKLSYVSTALTFPESPFCILSIYTLCLLMLIVPWGTLPASQWSMPASRTMH
jgi:hypothetical protein